MGAFFIELEWVRSEIDPYKTVRVREKNEKWFQACRGQVHSIIFHNF
jgi:hypothetical protein